MKPDRNGRYPRLVEVTDPQEQAAVLDQANATLESPIGAAHDGRVYAERPTLDAYRRSKGAPERG